MHARRLGRTELGVGEIGAGTRGVAWKGASPGDLQRALRHALEHDANVIDLVARDPDLELMVGTIVRELRARDRAVVIAKVAPVLFAGEARVPPGARLERVFPPGAVQASVEATLRASRLEVLPVCLFPCWYDAWIDADGWPELRGTLARLVDEGKVQHWGLAATGGGPAEAVRALADPVLAVVEVGYNLFDRRAEATVLAAAREHATGVIARGALDEGGLGGELGAHTTFAPGDPRTTYFTPDRLAEIAGRVGRLVEHIADPPPAAGTTDAAREARERGLLRRHGTAVEARTVADLALRFVLARPEVSTVVVGMRTIPHVMANLAAGDGRALSPALLERLAEHAWERDWAIIETPAAAPDQV